MPVTAQGHAPRMDIHTQILLSVKSKPVAIIRDKDRNKYNHVQRQADRQIRPRDPKKQIASKGVEGCRDERVANAAAEILFLLDAQWHSDLEATRCYPSSCP